jgi:hypothetical protein
MAQVWISYGLSLPFGKKYSHVMATYTLNVWSDLKFVSAMRARRSTYRRAEEKKSAMRVKGAPSGVHGSAAPAPE